MTAPLRNWWTQARLSILPQFHFQRGFDVESIDGEAIAPCWFLEVEWFAFHLQIAGGRFRGKDT